MLAALSPDGDLFTPGNDHDRGGHLMPQPGCPHCVVARARTTDPQTSHEAARRINQAGSVETDRALLLGLIRTYPGNTIPELARLYAAPGDDVEALRQRLGRRAKSLIDAGDVETSGVRDGCRVFQPRYR